MFVLYSCVDWNIYNKWKSYCAGKENICRTLRRFARIRFKFGEICITVFYKLLPKYAAFTDQTFVRVQSVCKKSLHNNALICKRRTRLKTG